MIKKTLLVLCALYGCTGFVAAQSVQDLNLWDDRQPGWRESLDLSDLPERIFGTKLEDIVVIDTEEENNALSEAVAKVSSLPVTGLVWSNTPENRRILLGDIVMREGQAIPSYVFGDNQYYTLVEISQNNMRFQVQIGDFTDPITFDVPFGLTEPVKNSSEYGSASSTPQK